jgi:hypothetical protein
MTESTEPTPPPIRPYRLRSLSEPEPEQPQEFVPERPVPRVRTAQPAPAAAGGAGQATADDRYGTRRGMSTPRKIGLGVIGVLMLGGVAGYIGWQQSHPAIVGTVVRYVAQNTSVAVTFEVDKAASKTATCTLQALDTRGNVIGSVAVQVPAGRGRSVMSYTLSTTSEANTVEVSSCSLTS